MKAELQIDEMGKVDRELEQIVARELEPLRDELARLRAEVAAMRDAFVPW